MRNLNRIGSLLALVATSLVVAPSALAQKGGSGGGTVESGVPLAFVGVLSIGGATPAWSGTYTLTHSIPGYYTWDTMQVSIKGKPLNVPDGSTLHVVCLFSDTITGAALPSVELPSLSCLKGLGTAKSTTMIRNPNVAQMFRHLDAILLQANDGTVVALATG